MYSLDIYKNRNSSDIAEIDNYLNELGDVLSKAEVSLEDTIELNEDLNCILRDVGRSIRKEFDLTEDEYYEILNKNKKQ